MYMGASLFYYSFFDYTCVLSFLVNDIFLSSFFYLGRSFCIFFPLVDTTLWKKRAFIFLHIAMILKKVFFSPLFLHDTLRVACRSLFY